MNVLQHICDHCMCVARVVSPALIRISLGWCGACGSGHAGHSYQRGLHRPGSPLHVAHCRMHWASQLLGKEEMADGSNYTAGKEERSAEAGGKKKTKNRVRATQKHGTSLRIQAR